MCELSKVNSNRLHSFNGKLNCVHTQNGCAHCIDGASTEINTLHSCRVCEVISSMESLSLTEEYYEFLFYFFDFHSVSRKYG